MIDKNLGKSLVMIMLIDHDFSWAKETTVKLVFFRFIIFLFAMSTLFIRWSSSQLSCMIWMKSYNRRRVRAGSSHSNITNSVDKRNNSVSPPSKYNIRTPRTFFHSRIRHLKSRGAINLEINEIEYQLLNSSCLGKRC